MSARRAVWRFLARLRDFVLPGLARSRGAGLFGDVMASGVKVTCPKCGNVLVSRQDVNILCYVSGDEFLNYRCPGCDVWRMQELPTAYSYLAHQNFPKVLMPSPPVAVTIDPINEDEFIEFGRKLYSADRVDL